MDVFVFQAALLCASCGEAVKTKLDRVAVEHGNVSFAYRDDSDKYPQGPFPNGGGEADCPQHCDHCKVFLENPLTGDGYAYVKERVAAWVSGDDAGFDYHFVRDRILDEADALRLDGEDAKARGLDVLALWLQYYGDEME